ncbi:phage tail tape measure protein, TP901 family, core region [Paenibacillus sophorae]|uniref:Phage tail tape measure protein n=1 Tax=Paenibacillus sophorae TaxID=1333845 RepID=A0A1H8JLF8_9BACL|nr:phage tail tape measure protein [Paenibacillus sophorae]QWU13406.1 phage tail tape measure protein [Paenibacillus sophorae]SEN81604.1 phage tail tape measure protein, TP901 family, core region [Paenibacillus sophorae]
MSNENLGILISAELNTGLSLKNINEGIKTLSSHPSLQKLKINISIDESFVKSLSSLTQNLNKVTNQLQQQALVNNDVSNSIRNTTQGIKEQTSATREAEKATNNWIKAQDKVNNKGKTTTYKSTINNDVQKVKTANDGAILDITNIKNYEKDAKDAQNIIEQMAQGRIASETRVREFERQWNENQQKAIQQNADLERNEIAKTQAYRQRYEQDYLKAIRLREIQDTKTYNNLNNKIANSKSSATTGIESTKALDLLNRKYTEIGQRVNELKNSGIQLTESELAGIQRRIQALGNLASRQKQMEKDSASLLSTQIRAEAQVNNLISRASLKDETKNQLTSLLSQLKTLDSSTSNFKGKAQQLTQNINRIGVEARNSSEHVHGLSKAFSNMAMYAGVGSVFYGSINLLKEMTQTIIQVDGQVTQLKRVMDSDTDFDEMLQKNMDMAEKFGISLQSVNDTAIEFGRMGFSGDQIDSLTKSATLAQNISEMSAKESVDAIVASMTNFNITASDSIKIVDELNEVDNNFSTTSKDLAIGLTKTANVGKVFGRSMENILGDITAIQQSTRESGSVVGNALKSIYSRLTTMDKSEDLLAQAGVKMKDMSGNVKTADQLITELAANFGHLNQETQENIAVGLAGRNHMSRFIALLQNHNISVKAAETALNSQGSAMQENEKRINSLEARIERMKAVWQSFSVAMGESVISDTIAVITSLMSGLGRVFEFAAKHIGGLPLIFGALNAVLFLTSKGFRELSIGLTASILKLFGVVPAATAAEVGIIGVAGALNIAKAALRGLLASTVIGAVFAVIGFAAEKLINHFAKTTDATNGLTTSLEDLDQKSSELSNLKNLSNDYELLSKKTSLTADEKAKLDKVETELQNTYGISLTNLNGQTDATGANIAAIKNRTAALQEEIKTMREKAILDYQTQQVDINKNIEEQTKKVEKLNEAYVDAQRQQTTFTNDRAKGKYSNLSTKELDRIAQDLANGVETAKKAFDDENTELQKSVEKKTQALKSEFAIYIDGLRDSGQNISSQAEQLAEVYAVMAGKSSDNETSIFSNFKQAFEIIKNIKADNINDLVTAFEKLPGVATIAPEVKKALETLLVPGITGLIDGTDAMGDSFKTLEDALNEVERKFDSAANTIKSLTEAQKELKENHKLSADTLFDLVSKYPDLLKYVDDEKALNRELSKAIKDERNVQKEAFKEKLTLNEQFFSNMIKGNKNVWPLVAKAYEKDYKDFKTVADAKKKTNDLLLQAIGSDWNKYFANEKLALQEVIQAPMKYRNPSPELKKQLEERAEMAKSQLAAIEAMEKPIDLSVNGNIDWSTSLDDAKKSTDKFTDSTSDTVEILTDLQERIKANADALDRLHSRQSRMKKGTEEYKKSILQEIALLKEQKKLYDEGYEHPERLVSTKVTTTTKTTTNGGGSSSSSSYSSGNSSSSTGDYSDIINKNASANKVDANLIKAIVAQESSFNPNATSHAGAQGLMQLMPDTARSLGVKNSYDPEQNIAGGTKYFAGLLKQFDGDVELALMAYNGGPSRIEKWRKTGKSIAALPKETQQYASKVLGKYNSYTGKSTSSTISSANGVAKTTVKAGDISTTVKTDGPTAEEKSDAKENAKQKSNEIGDLLYQQYILLLDETKLEFENKIADEQRKIDDSKRVQDTLDPNSVAWRQENNKQNNLKSNIQNIKHDEKNELTWLMNYLGVQNADYDQFLKQLSAEWKDIQADKNSTAVSNLDSQIAESRQAITDYGDSIEVSKNKMAQFAVGAEGYNKELNYQIATTKKQKSANDELIQFYENLLKDGKLAPGVIAKYTQELQELKKEDYASTVKDLNEQLAASKSYHLEQKLSDLNNQLDLSKAKMKGLREGTDEYNKETKNQINIINDQIAVTKELIANEEIQSKNEELSASDREDHKKKLQEYTLSLYDYSDAIKSLRADYADKIIDNYKKMLQEQQKLQDAAYDKQKEAEDARHEARMNNLDDELSRFNDVINAQSKSLDRDVAAEDYQDQLSKLQKEKAELDAKFSSKLLDDSLEGKAARADIQKEIDAKQEEIAKLQRDREITIRKDGLQDQLEDRQKAIDKEKKLEDDKNKDILKGIEDAKKKNDEYYDGLLNDEQYFYNMKQALMSEDTVKVQNELNIVQAAYDTFFKDLESKSGVYGAKIAENLKYSIGLDKDYAKNFPLSDGNGSASGNGQIGVGGNSSNSPIPNPKDTPQARSAWQAYLSNKQQAELIRKDMEKSKKDKAKYTKLENDFNALKGKNDVIRSQYTWFPEGSYDELKNKDIFSAETGGMTPANIGKEGKFLLAHEKELVLNKFDTSRILESVNIVRSMTSNLGNLNRMLSPNVYNKNSNSVTNPVINIRIDNVEGTKEGAKIVTDSIERMWEKKFSQGN